MIAQTFARTALWLCLGGWVGSWAFFAFVVSRVAFRVLPGDVAGDLAGMLLSVLHWGGVGMALIVAGSTFALGRRGWLVWVPIFLAALCAASEVWLSPEVAAIRPSVLGADATQETSLRFSRLHSLSLGLFVAIHAVTLALVGVHAFRDAQTLGPRLTE